MKGDRFISYVQIMLILGLLSFINTKFSPAGLSLFIRYDYNFQECFHHHHYLLVLEVASLSFRQNGS